MPSRIKRPTRKRVIKNRTRKRLIKNRTKRKRLIKNRTRKRRKNTMRGGAGQGPDSGGGSGGDSGGAAATPTQYSRERLDTGLSAIASKFAKLELEMNQNKKDIQHMRKSISEIKKDTDEHYNVNLDDDSKLYLPPETDTSTQSMEDMLTGLDE